MNNVEMDFKLADSFQPGLGEGKYTIQGTQEVTMPVSDHFSATKDFYVAANAETISPEEIFSIYPAAEQRGDFTGTLPFLVLKNPGYPWIRRWTDDIDGLQVPWLALIVVSQNEEPAEMDVKHSELVKLKEDGVFFPYKENAVTLCRPDDSIHILTIPKAVYDALMPAKEDLPWLAHAKFVNLSAAEDEVAQQDGWFSTIIANRFVPFDQEMPLKSTVHLVTPDGYLNGSIPSDCERVRFISIYHWNLYSEKTEEKSFVSLAEGLGSNSGAVRERALKPHFLRTGEKTYSIYHSPLLPFPSARYDNINGEERYTADGRLIYQSENGIFDISYAAAFNLGRMITLSRRLEAEKIAAWRKDTAMQKHLDKLACNMEISVTDLCELCSLLTEEEGG